VPRWLGAPATAASAHARTRLPRNGRKDRSRELMHGGASAGLWVDEKTRKRSARSPPRVDAVSVYVEGARATLRRRVQLRVDPGRDARGPGSLDVLGALLCEVRRVVR